MDKTNKSNTMMIVVVAIIALVAVGFFMMMKKTPTETQTITTDTNQTAQPTEAMEEADTASPTQATEVDTTAVKTVNVEAGSFYYKPNVITVKKGEKVKIIMKSVDMMHDFNIDELNVKMPVTKSGMTDSVEFTATTVGTFEYYCSVGQHRAKGQVGKLIVQ